MADPLHVKLPGKTKDHPIEAMVKLFEDEGMTLRYAAKRHFNVTEQSLFGWIARARKNRNYNLPPKQVIKICKLTGQAPYLYNPKIWPNPEWRV